MKTSELKKIVCDNGCIFNEILNDVVNLKNSEDVLIGYVLKEESKQFSIYPECPKKIAQAILEYAYTPLEERGKEKKYSLKMPLNAIVNKSFTDELILCRNNTLNEHCFLSNHNYSDRKHIQTSFTQKEIDEMPFDTKFFEKVEVK